MKKILLIEILLLCNLIQAQHDVLTFQSPKYNGALSTEFLEKIAHIFNINVFIETGTQEGYTVRNAIPFFKEIHTIELWPEFYENAVKNFKNYSNVFLHFGDSAEVLEKIVPEIKGNLCFWLDAHNSGDGTAGIPGSTPILEELQAIKKANCPEAIILIDDMMWHNYNYGKEPAYPNFKQLVEILYDINVNYQIVVVGDILAAFPFSAKNKLSSMLKATSISILANRSLDEIQDAERTIAHALSTEKKAIDQYWQIYKNHSYSDIPIFNLWKGLILLGESRYSEAIVLIRRAIDLGIYHSRLYLYLDMAKKRLNL